MLKVFIGCEFSGTVRDAFINAGHYAISVDLLPTESPLGDRHDFLCADGQYHSLGTHHVGDVLDVFTLLHDEHYMEFDIGIFHPPCTYLANSGERWLKDNPDRQAKRIDALEFVKKIWSLPIPMKCIENPIGHLSTAWLKPTQIVQPFHFGHPEWKSTCLWLDGLPALQATDNVAPDATVGGGKKPGRISSRIHRLGPSEDRWKERSKTYTGLAKAMAEQWGQYASIASNTWRMYDNPQS
jgi:hypothetical protein